MHEWTVLCSLTLKPFPPWIQELRKGGVEIVSFDQKRCSLRISNTTFCCLQKLSCPRSVCYFSRDRCRFPPLFESLQTLLLVWWSLLFRRRHVLISPGWSQISITMAAFEAYLSFTLTNTFFLLQY